VLGLGMISKQSTQTLLTVEKSLSNALPGFFFMYTGWSPREWDRWCCAKVGASWVIFIWLAPLVLHFKRWSAILVNHMNESLYGSFHNCCSTVPDTRLGGWSSSKHLIKQRNEGVGYVNWFHILFCLCQMCTLWSFGWPKDTFSFQTAS
jgi:hypothetical protein